MFGRVTVRTHGAEVIHFSAKIITQQMRWRLHGSHIRAIGYDLWRRDVFP